MAVLALQEASAGLQSVTFAAAAAGGDSVPSGVKASAWELPVVLIVRNAHTAAQNVIVDGVTYIVPLTSGVAVIPIRAAKVGELKPVTYSGVTALTVAAVHLAPFD